VMTEVTCAIIRRGDLVLATQRGEGMAHPLKWEFPGGKIRPGESPETCITREIQEELGVLLRIEKKLPPVVHRYGGVTISLIPFIGTIGEGHIRLAEHRACRWLSAGELDEADWLEADAELVRFLKVHLK